MPVEFEQGHMPLEPPKAKKRRLPGACDACRKKRVKCDSAEMPNNICSNCIASGVVCLHETPYKKQEVENYIAFLEQRNQALEQTIREMQHLHPDRDFLDEVNSRVGPPPSSRNANSPLFTSNSSSVAGLPVSIPPVDPLSALASNPLPDGPELDHTTSDVAKRLSDMKIELADDRFFGRSSNFALMSQAMAMKEAYEGAPPGDNKSNKGGKFKREVYWSIHPWEEELLRPEAQHSCHFPPTDLLEILVSAYLTHVNSFYPLFHRPTLEKQVRDKLYFEDPSFGKLVLAMCAVGSRYSDDPRILSGAPDGTTLSAGYQWFSQLRLVHTRYFFDVLSLTDVQTICVSMFYVFGTSLPHGCWTLVGFGLRACQERGIDKRLPSGSKTTRTVDDELWKRAFWILVLLDRQLCTFAGRPTAVSSEDIEIDWPAECDDEYWEIVPETGQVSFHQPPGQPALPTGFIVYLRLCELHAISIRTLYASPRSRATFGVTGENWEKKVVTELDSILNLWLDNVPSHLRWDPTRENPVHFDQSCLLYIVYYGLQIQIHRPFINRKGSPLAFPSLAICTNSARACCHILEAQVRRGSLKLPPVMMVANIAAYILLMTIYGAKKYGLSINPAKELESIQMAKSYLSKCDKHWHIAGRFYDLINETASAAVSASPSSTTTTTKRGREEMETTSGRTSSLSTRSQQQHKDTLSPLPLDVNGHALAALVGEKSLRLDLHSQFAPTTTTTTTAGSPLLDINPSFTLSPSSTTTTHPTDWNINPYAFPSFPSGSDNTMSMLYPQFHIDPSLNSSSGALGLEDLERLSHQMISTSSPVEPQLPDWESIFGPSPTDFPFYLV